MLANGDDYKATEGGWVGIVIGLAILIGLAFLDQWLPWLGGILSAAFLFLLIETAVG